MPKDPSIKALEVQTALAVAALGVSFERTLALISDKPRVSETLKIEAGKLYEHLATLPDSEVAQKMFATFIRALHDPSIVGQR